MASPRSNSPLRRIAGSLLLSLILHLLLLIAFEQWVKEPVERVLHPIRFRPEREIPERFQAPRPRGLPAAAMERLEDTQPREVPTEMPHQVEIPDFDQPFLVTEEFHEGDRAVGLRADTLRSLEQLKLDMFRRRVEELESYERLVLPDIDTTDVESQSRSRALDVIRRAIEAMGGVGALTDLHYLTYRNRFHKSYGTHSKYAEKLTGGARLVFDGERGWIDVYGIGYPLKNEGLREVERRSERWDFLSRYLGDGVRVSYLGTQVSVQQEKFDVLLVEDMKFGGAPYRGLFDTDSGLLVAEQYQVGERWLTRRYLDYAHEERSYIWHLIEEGGEARPLSYAPIPDALFAVSEPDTAWGRLETFESRQTLWIEVVITNDQAAAAGLLPGAKRKLTGLQRAMVQIQTLNLFVDDISRRGLFPRVLPISNAAGARGLREGDYVLEVILENAKRQTLHYQAKLYEATARKQIMQDGPPNSVYHGMCSYYELLSFTVDIDVAYVMRERLQRLAVRTFDKMMPSTRQFDRGQRRDFPYMNYCCYCQSP